MSKLSFDNYFYVFIVATYNHFYELPVYNVCRAFRKKISGIVRKYFPKSETYLLSAQVLDSSRSITANIAEGFGRFHYQENIQYCRQSRGSLTESLDHMNSAFDDNYIGIEILNDITNDYKECLKQLNSYIKYLKKAKLGTDNNE